MGKTIYTSVYFPISKYVYEIMLDSVNGKMWHYMSLDVFNKKKSVEMSDDMWDAESLNLYFLFLRWRPKAFVEARYSIVSTSVSTWHTISFEMAHLLFVMPLTALTHKI